MKGMPQISSGVSLWSVQTSEKSVLYSKPKVQNHRIGRAGKDSQGSSPNPMQLALFPCLKKSLTKRAQGFNSYKSSCYLFMGFHISFQLGNKHNHLARQTLEYAARVSGLCGYVKFTPFFFYIPFCIPFIQLLCTLSAFSMHTCKSLSLIT